MSTCRYHLRTFKCRECGQVKHEGLVNGMGSTYGFTCKDCLVKDHSHCKFCGTKLTQSGYNVCWFCYNNIPDELIKRGDKE